MIKLALIYVVGIIVFTICSVSISQTTGSADSSFVQNYQKQNALLEFPNVQGIRHDIGNIGLMVGNLGKIGWTGRDEYPLNSNITYLRSADLWLGGIKDGDTLVSATFGGNLSSFEFKPDIGEAGAIIARSILKSRPEFHVDAISEQDFICTYTDTFTSPGIVGVDPFDNRAHKPLGVEVVQSSFAWSYDFAANFILIHYRIKNIDTLPITEMYFGTRIDNRIYHLSKIIESSDDDLQGYLPVFPTPPGSCREYDTLNMVWGADNDGDPTDSSLSAWNFASPRAVYGFRILQAPKPGLVPNYNWWAYTGIGVNNTFGPRLSNNFRHFHNGMGRPTGDKNKYYMMAHPEIDYDQMFTAIDHSINGFLPPPATALAVELASGSSSSMLLSIGPFDLLPGNTVPVTIAYILGDDFHVEPSDYKNFFTPDNPSTYYNRLDFSDLAQNARFADAVFDNPGIDTDGDGYRGRFVWNCYLNGERICYQEGDKPPDSILGSCRKEFFKGDGIPDFRPAGPPPAPIVRVIPNDGGAILRWNGKDSEDYIEFLTQEKGFEGYRVYMAEDNRLTDYVMLSQFDLDDYMVFRFNQQSYSWDGISTAITRDSLQLLYGNDFEPMDYYDEHHSYYDPATNENYFFRPQEWNQSDLSNQYEIHRRFPDANPDDPSDVTEEGYVRYYEYEYSIDNLSRGKPYYFAVTAFNRGSFNRSIWVMESSPVLNSVRAYPLISSDSVEHYGLKAIVYPNPYRIDGGYARAGYENRARVRSAEWARRIHFANLPKICTIRIYTMTGDLVQEIKHFNPSGGPESQHEEWNVISRNTQAVVTGIYLWSVRSEMGEQIGRLVIIK